MLEFCPGVAVGVYRFVMVVSVAAGLKIESVPKWQFVCITALTSTGIAIASSWYEMVV
jgi:hypothetical protein